MKRLVFDFETRSACDLKKRGAYLYSLDPTTQPTCMAAKFSNNPALMFLDFFDVNQPWNKIPQGFRFHWQKAIKENYEFAAHNAFFEKCIYTNILVKRYGWPAIPSKQYRCTAAKAAACALPRNLEGAGEAMNLAVQKDKSGYFAMMKTCKPTKAWNAWVKKGSIGTQPQKYLEPQDDPVTWKTLYHYCKIDVQTEELLDLALPDLIPIEQEIWHLNQELNWRGIQVDLPTVNKIVGMMEIDSKKKLKQLDTLTRGLVTKAGATKSILDFLELEGVKLPNLRAKTVDDQLQGFEIEGDMRKLLELRKALSKTSTRKYRSMIDRAGSDHRVRDILMYHGASTGRDTGTGLQIHNLPRNLIPQKEIEYIIKMIEEL